MTPYERLKFLPQAESYLRPGITLEKLGTIANQMSNNEFAERMMKARSNLFEQITGFAKRVARSCFPSFIPISTLSKKREKVANEERKDYHRYYYHSDSFFK